MNNKILKPLRIIGIMPILVKYKKLPQYYIFNTVFRVCG